MQARVLSGLALREGRVGRVLVTFMALGFMALLAAGLAALWATSRSRDYTGWVNHTYDVRVAVAQAETLIERGETSRRGFLLSEEERYVATHDDARRRLTPTLDRMASLTADNARQRQRMATLRGILQEQDRLRRTTIELTRAGRADAARAAFIAEASVARLGRIRELLAEMEADELNLLAQRGQDQTSIVYTFYLLLAAAGVVLALVATAAILAVRRYTDDLAASRDKLRTFNETLEEQVAERTADLTRANDEIQRFAYIVSHDLRSPLVNVMGFTAELEAATGPLADLVGRAEAEAPGIVSEEARLAAREDLPEAIGFIRASTQKMDRLINAILKLSREGRRVIAPEPLDLDGLVDGVAGSIQHLVDERGAIIEVEKPLPRIVHDRVAIEQILSNLIENATKYLQPGRPGRITVSGSTEGGRVALAVADNGRGIAPSDHQRIFDLFRRSGAQDQPGEGIGLAHVRALVHRLGGVIDVESELGRGSTFRLSLPTRLEPA